MCSEAALMIFLSVDVLLEVSLWLISGRSFWLFGPSPETF